MSMQSGIKISVSKQKARIVTLVQTFRSNKLNDFYTMTTTYTMMGGSKPEFFSAVYACFLQ